MFCPNCRTVNEKNYRYCYQCGFPLPEITEEDVPIFPVEPAAAAEPILPEETITEAVTTVEAPAPTPEPVAVSPKPTNKGRLLPPLLLLLAMMAIGLWAFFASPQPAADPEPTADPMPWFTVTNGVLSFDESKYQGEPELVVPPTINGQTVTAIGKGCFAKCRDLTTVILPDTITEIRQEAFSDCTSLRGIFIPEGVKNIEANALHNCLVLEAIHLPESLQTLDSRSFSRCRKLVHIFYAGTYKNWTAIYTGVLPFDAWIYCKDGNYPCAQE